MKIDVILQLNYSINLVLLRSYFEVMLKLEMLLYTRERREARQTMLPYLAGCYFPGTVFHIFLLFYTVIMYLL